MRRLVLAYIFFSYCISGYSQYTGNTRFQRLQVTSDTLKIDTLSLVPNSIKFTTPTGKSIDSSFYKINYAEGIVVINRKKLKESNIASDTILSAYKVFPYLFSSETKHKDVKHIKADLSGNVNPFSYSIVSKNDDIFKMDGLNKSGSISRGISFGNNQDVVVNSNLNLQLSGHLNNNVDILLAATDNNIPIQPEGNTQQLQEFDKVFIQLNNQNTKLIAGDFQMARPYGYFMSFNKKAQGISFATSQKINSDKKDLKEQGIYTTGLSAAISRGKFARNQIQGIENVQGPYRLRGAENETFIIILSGTEKVYIDGLLMNRGQENDYVIDYNTAEIIFTAKRLITKDKRIVVEFQYSDKNYARSLIHVGNEYEQNKVKLHLHMYSEQDSKNQSIQQDLSPEQKQLLSQVGDDLSLAIAPSYSSVLFNTNEVLYYKTDTSVGSTIFKDVFVYSPTKSYVSNGVPDSTHYRVTYSNVGVNQGNYIQVATSANGKVFQWIMPDSITNMPRGNYEPVVQLITPKQKQMLTAGVDYALNKNSKLFVEGAISKNDINTFSNTNNKDDVGYGLKMNFENKTPILKDQLDSGVPTIVTTNVNYEYAQKYFSPIERFRSVEFERDWNRGTVTQTDDQNILGASIGLSKEGIGAIGYKLNAFVEGENYSGIKHNATVAASNKSGFDVFYDGNLLSSKSIMNTDFYRHKSGVSQKIKWFTIGLKDEFEKNEFKASNKDSLLSNSYKFWEWQAYMQNADTTQNRYGINYKERTDYAVGYNPGETNLVKTTYARSYNGFLDVIKHPNNQLKFNVSYRTLKIEEPLLTLQKPDNSLIARAEYNAKLWKGFVFSSTFYEIGSGLEVKKEYSYISVAVGQGVYVWNDYNENGIKELNEFEVAVFSNTADYIKVYTPTNDYIKVFNNQFSQSLMLKPAALWSNKDGIKKFIARFANQTSYQVSRKSTERNLAKAYNPFLVDPEESALMSLNSSFRNTLFINQLSPLFGLDLTYQDARNKVLLVYGFDSRVSIIKEARLRWNITKEFSWNISYQTGDKRSSSQYFSTRDYAITYSEVEPKLIYQPNTAFRITGSYSYKMKKNKEELGGQIANLQNYGAELKYNILQKGSLNFKINLIQVKYDGEQNNSLAFEMLDALKVGQNITWGVSYQRTLSNNLQLSLNYDGRKSSSPQIIHTGGAQVRAYF